jgi:hypothetical protein
MNNCRKTANIDHVRSKDFAKTAKLNAVCESGNAGLRRFGARRNSFCEGSASGCSGRSRLFQRAPGELQSNSIHRGQLQTLRAVLSEIYPN